MYCISRIVLNYVGFSVVKTTVEVVVKFYGFVESHINGIRIT
jgi:hypothetical protein